MPWVNRFSRVIPSCEHPVTAWRQQLVFNVGRSKLAPVKPDIRLMPETPRESQREDAPGLSCSIIPSVSEHVINRVVLQTQRQPSGYVSPELVEGRSRIT